MSVNGSGWIVSQLVSIDLTFSEMDNLPKPKKVKRKDKDDNKDQ